MNFEIEMIGVDEQTMDALAICFRYFNELHNR